MNSNYINRSFSKKFLVNLRKSSTVVIACLGISLSSAQAATVTWTGATGGDWNVGTNWSTSSKPATADTALFNTALSTVANATADQTVTSMSFDTAAGTAGGTFTIGTTGGNKFTLTNLGAISVLSTLTGTGKTIAINSPLVLAPASISTAGFYTFSNANSTATNTLNIGGTVTGGNTSSTETLFLSGANVGNNTISGNISNGLATGGLGLVKNSTGTWLLTGSNSYTGPTTITQGTLQLSGATGTNSGGATTYNINATGTLQISNLVATGGNNNDRINDASAIVLNGGSFIYNGNDNTSTVTQSTETVGAITGGILNSTITLNQASGTAVPTVTAASLTHAGGNGAILVDGNALGKDSTSTSGLARLILTTAPTLVGTTNATSTGQNFSSQNTKIVPFLVGFVQTNGFQLGTVPTLPGAYTFLTYNASTGLRPLALTGTGSNTEFTVNTVTSGNNTVITGATTSSANTSINSLVLMGGDLSVASSTTLADTSGGVIFNSTNAIKPSSGTATFDFGAAEGMVFVAPSVTGTISTNITGTNTTNGLTKSGTGTLVLGGSNTYTGLTTVNGGTLSVTSAAGLGATGAGNGTVLYSVQTGTSPAVQSSTLNVSGGITIAEDITSNLDSSAGLGTEYSFNAINSSGNNNLAGTLSFVRTGSTLNTVTSGNNDWAVNSTSGTLTLSGTIQGGKVGVTADGGDRLILQPSGGAAITVSGLVQNGTGTTSGLSVILYNPGAAGSTGTVTMSNVNNSYTGQTVVRDGTLIVAADSLGGTATTGALGSAGSGAIRLSDGATAQNSTPALLTQGAVNIGRDFIMNDSSAVTTHIYNATLGGSDASTSNFTGNMTYQANFNLNDTLKLNLTAAAGGTVDYFGALPTTSGVNNGSTLIVTKTGQGVVALYGSGNTYAGGTTISAGTLEAGASSTAATTTGTTNNLAYSTGATTISFTTLPTGLVVGDVISGTGFATGSTIITAINTTTKVITISQAVTSAGAANQNFSIGAAGSVGTGVITLGDTNSGSSNPTFLTDGAVTVSNAITVSSNGTGVDTLGTTNSGGTGHFTGAITLNKAVTLQAGAGATSSFDTGSITTNNNAITVGSTGNTGTVNLGEAVSTTGGVAVNFGTLAVNAALSSNATVAAGATLTNSNTITGNLSTSGTYNGTGTLTGNATVNSGGLLGGSGTISGTTSVTGGTINGSGLNLTGTTTFSSGSNTLGGTVNANGGLFVTGSATVAQSGTTTGNVSYTSSGASTFSGAIAGAGKTLTLNNSSALLTLSGSNTYSGATTITAGTLKLTGNNAASATQINGGKLTGTGTAGALTLATGGNITPGDSTTLPGASSSLSASSLTWTGNSSSSLTFVLATSTQNSTQLNLGLGAFTNSGTGQLTLVLSGGEDAATLGTAAYYNLVDFGSTNFALTDFAVSASLTAGNTGYLRIASIGGGQSALQFVVIPEPSTYAMMLGGVAFLAFLLRRKNARVGMGAMS